MADIIDDANEKAELFLAAALASHHSKPKVSTPGIGICLNCSADVEGERRWCDAACRNDWELDQKRRERK